MYRGEQVLDVASDKRKKLARAKQKMRDRGEEPESIDQATILQPDESVQVNS